VELCPIILQREKHKLIEHRVPTQWQNQNSGLFRTSSAPWKQEKSIDALS